MNLCPHFFNRLARFTPAALLLSATVLWGAGGLGGTGTGTGTGSGPGTGGWGTGTRGPATRPATGGSATTKPVATAPAADNIHLRWHAMGEPGCGGAAEGGTITTIAVSPVDSKHILIGGSLMGVAISVDHAESWQASFGFASWEIAQLTFHPTDPKTVWAGTMSGPAQSWDGGRQWKMMRTGMPAASPTFYTAPIEKVLIDPRDGKRLLAFCGTRRKGLPAGAAGEGGWGTVWESLDAGEHWTPHGKVANDAAHGVNILDAQFAVGEPDTLYAVAHNRGVFVSIDGGRIWQSRSKGLPNWETNALAVHPKDKATLWVALGNAWIKGEGDEKPKLVAGGIYKSVDAGMTWTDASKGLNRTVGAESNATARYEAIAVGGADGNELITGDTSSNATLYKSVDGGTSWQAIATKKNIDSDYPAPLAMTAIAIDPRDPNAIFAGGAEYAIRSLDGGKIWTDVTSMKGTIPGLRKGRGLSALYPLNIRFDPGAPKHITITGLGHGNFAQTRDGMNNWARGTGELEDPTGAYDIGFLVAGSATGESGKMFVTLGQNGLFDGIALTSDGGKTWKVVAGAAHGLPEKNTPTGETASLWLGGAVGKTAWATIGGKLYQSDDGGENWKAVGGPGGSNGLTWLTEDPQQPTGFYACGATGIFRGDENGNLKLVPGSPQKIHRLAVDAEGRIYAAVWHETNGGLWKQEHGKWTKIREDMYIAGVTVDPHRPEHVAVSTDDLATHDQSGATGVWISHDGGKTWSQQNDGLAVLRGSIIAFNPVDSEQLVLGTTGRGFWATRWSR